MIGLSSLSSASIIRLPHIDTSVTNLLGLPSLDVTEPGESKELSLEAQDDNIRDHFINLSSSADQFHLYDYGYAGTAQDTIEFQAYRSSTAQVRVNGMGGSDQIYTAKGNDIVFGGSGDDVVRTFEGKDLVYGGSGNDQIEGGGGQNTLSGGTGNDYLNGGWDDDILVGGSGSDVLWANEGNDRLYGGSGSDSLTGNDGNDFIQGGSGADYIDGDRGLSAYGGDDKLEGGAGNDTINGGVSRDVLCGDAGADALTGGSGTDTFLFKARSDSTVVMAGRDTIIDFAHNQADRMDLHLIDANLKLAGDQSFTFIKAAAFTHHAGELRAVTSGNTTVVSGDVNGDAVADFAINVNKTAFVAGDFIL